MRRLWLALLVAPLSAQEAPGLRDECSGLRTTCTPDELTCCAQWVIDISLDGKVWGALLEDSYERLDRSLAAAQRTDRQLCRYFGAAETSCRNEYSAPRCASDPAVGKAMSELGARSVDAWLGTIDASSRTLATAREQLRSLSTLSRLELPSGEDIANEVRERAAQAAPVLQEYSELQREGAQRVRSLQTSLDRCFQQVNPFGPLDDGADPWSVGGRFGGHAERRQRDVMQQAGQRALRRLTHVPQTVPAARRVELPANAIVVADVATGLARTAFGKSSLKRGMRLPAGAYDLYYVGVQSGQLVFGTTEVSTQVAPEGTVTRIRSASPLGVESIELLTCGAERELENDRCQCTGGRIANGSACVCPRSAPKWNSDLGQCTVCPDTSVWNGSDCYCPRNMPEWNSSTQRCEARPPPPPPRRPDPPPMVGASGLVDGMRRLGSCNRLVPGRDFGCTTVGDPETGDYIDDAVCEAFDMKEPVERYVNAHGWCRSPYRIPEGCVPQNSSIATGTTEPPLMRAFLAAVPGSFHCFLTPWHDTDVPNHIWACCLRGNGARR